MYILLSFMVLEFEIFDICAHKLCGLCLQPREADQPPSPMVPFLDKFASKDVNSCNSVSGILA